MNEENVQPSAQEAVTESSRNVTLRSKVASEIAQKLEKKPIDIHATEQERDDWKKIQAVRGKFEESIADSNKVKVHVPLTADEIALVKNYVPKAAMGIESRIQHELLTELEDGYHNAGQNERIKQRSSIFITKVRQLLKIFFH